MVTVPDHCRVLRVNDPDGGAGFLLGLPGEHMLVMNSNTADGSEEMAIMSAETMPSGCRFPTTDEVKRFKDRQAGVLQ